MTNSEINLSAVFLTRPIWLDVRLETIRKILCALKNPEILLTFTVDALIDFLSVKTAETQALLNIDLNREDVRALTDLRTGEGWRYLIQHALYRHIQNRTGSRFYTPFFIHSVEAHRPYWLLHLSNHRQARDEMGKLHWRLSTSAVGSLRLPRQVHHRGIHCSVCGKKIPQDVELAGALLRVAGQEFRSALHRRIPELLIYWLHMPTAGGLLGSAISSHLPIGIIRCASVSSLISLMTELVPAWPSVRHSPQAKRLPPSRGVGRQLFE